MCWIVMSSAFASKLSSYIYVLAILYENYWIKHVTAEAELPFLWRTSHLGGGAGASIDWVEAALPAGFWGKAPAQVF